MLPKSNQKSTRCKSLEQDLELGYGDPYAIPYPMFQYRAKALNALGKGIMCTTLDMRKHCVDCLQKLGDFKAVDLLIQMFDDIENEPITGKNTAAIEQIYRLNNLTPVFNPLHSGAPRIRKSIAILVTDYIDDKDETVLPELIKALKDPDTDVEYPPYCRMEAFRFAS